MKGLTRQVVAFAFLFSNRKQPDPWMLHTENRTAVNIAHHRELLQIHCGAIDVRADIKQNGRRVQNGGKRCRQRRTVHAGKRAQHNFGGGHGRARIACGYETRGPPLAYQP